MLGYIMGGGILPIAIHNHKIYFLFGKETYDNDTKGWADFGGGKEHNETVFETAIREGGEELNGFLGSDDVLKKRVKLNMVHVEKSRQYSTYLFLIDYNKDLPTYYNNNFRFFASRLPEVKKEHNGLLEKSHIKWYSFEDLRRDKKKFRRFYQEFIDQFLRQQDQIEKKVFEKKNKKDTRKNRS